MESKFLSRTAATVAMADSMDGLFLQSGLTVTVVGWGSTDGNPQSMTAGERTLVACSEIPEWAVCTQSEGMPTIQGGDSGGPVLLELDGEWRLMAVNSWRDPATTPAHSRYVRVAEHREWIDSVLDGTVETPESGCPVPPDSMAPANSICVALGDSGQGVKLETTGAWTSIDTWIGEFGAHYARVTAGGEQYRIVYETRRSGRVWFSRPEHCPSCNVDSTVDLAEHEELACDPSAGNDVAPVVQPPPPPPAPEPFQPQPVKVALGESGSTVTLMTAEGGGYTLNGQAFAGGEVTAENGDKYLLALEDGKWTASKVDP